MARIDETVRFDWAIKRLLRHKADHTILNGFLSSLLGREIRIQKMLESESNQDFQENKYNRVDMLAEDQDGKKILIEVQNETEDSYFHRMLFGTSKIITDFITTGQGFDNISKVYSINIVYFKLGEGSDYIYHGKTEFRGLHNGELLTLSPKIKAKYKVNEVSEIYPEYYILKANDFDSVAKTSLEQWMYFLKHSELPEGADAPGLRQAAEELRIGSLSQEERQAYYRYMDNMLSLEDMVESAWSSGLFEGRLEGRLEGLKEAARRMKSQGYKEEEIEKILGISPDRSEE